MTDRAGMITTDGDAAGTWLAVRIEGELDTATHERARTQLRAVASSLRRGCAVSVDLAGLTFADVGAVDVLRDFVDRCRGAGCTPRIEHAPRLVLVITELLGIDLPFA